MGYKLKRILIYPDGVTEKQVYPKTRNPGENTILYCPLESDIDNHAGTTFTMATNGTPTQQTVGYYFPKGTNTVAYIYPTSNGTAVSETQLVGTLPYTISVWVKSVSGVSSTTNYSFVFNTSWYNSGYIAGCSWIIYGTGSRFEVFNGSATSINPTISDSTQWHLYTVVIKQSQQLLYQDTTLVGTSNKNYVLGTGTYGSGGTVTFPGRNYDNGRNKGGYMGAVLVEKGEWSLADIGHYYNLTKSNYGL